MPAGAGGPAGPEADGGQDGGAPGRAQPETQIHADPAAPEGELPGRPRAPEEVPRQLHTTKAFELEKYVYTEICPGCIAAFLNEKAKAQSAECRAGILEEMRKAGDRADRGGRPQESQRRPTGATGGQTST